MLLGEHFAILSTFIKPPFVIRIFVLSFFEWPFYTVAVFKTNYCLISTFIKLPFVIKIFVLSIFEWPFYTGFTVFDRMKTMWFGYRTFNHNKIAKKLFIY